MSGDLKRVKTLTMGHHLIMGRKTYESIGRPLPGRTTVIISRQKDYAQDGCIVVDSLQSAIKIASYDDEAFIFGGGEIFKEAIPYTQKIYLTRVHCIVHGDVHFPQLNHAEWNLISEVNYSADEKNEFDCTVEEWRRK
jgi:dihydrofolate reductase